MLVAKLQHFVEIECAYSCLATVFIMVDDKRAIYAVTDIIENVILAKRKVQLLVKVVFMISNLYFVQFVRSVPIHSGVHTNGQTRELECTNGASNLHVNEAATQEEQTNNNEDNKIQESAQNNQGNKMEAEFDSPPDILMLSLPTNKREEDTRLEENKNYIEIYKAEVRNAHEEFVAIFNYSELKKSVDVFLDNTSVSRHKRIVFNGHGSRRGQLQFWNDEHKKKSHRKLRSKKIPEGKGKRKRKIYKKLDHVLAMIKRKYEQKMSDGKDFALDIVLAQCYGTEYSFVTDDINFRVIPLSQVQTHSFLRRSAQTGTRQSFHPDLLDFVENEMRHVQLKLIPEKVLLVKMDESLSNEDFYSFLEQHKLPLRDAIDRVYICQAQDQSNTLTLSQKFLAGSCHHSLYHDKCKNAYLSTIIIAGRASNLLASEILECYQTLKNTRRSSCSADILVKWFCNDLHLSVWPEHIDTTTRMDIEDLDNDEGSLDMWTESRVSRRDLYGYYHRNYQFILICIFMIHFVFIPTIKSCSQLHLFEYINFRYNSFGCKQ